MNFKIQIIASLLTALCAAEPPAYPEQAISSQSYTREDVPLSYKHSAVHVYTMTNPTTTRKQTPLSTSYYQTTHAPEYQQAVQYARVLLNHNKDEKMGPNNGLYTQALIPTTTEGASYTNLIDTTTLRKDHLEPKKFADEQKSIPFITGHNINLNQVQRPRYVAKEAAKYLYTSKRYNGDHASHNGNNVPIPVVMTNMNSRLKTFYNVPRREIFVPQLCNKAVISYTHNRGELLKNDKTLPQRPEYILFTKLPEVHNRKIDMSTMSRNRPFPKQLP